MLQHQGVDLIIALGHSGFHVDKVIAGQVEGIDIIVGGHTNTFLYNGMYVCKHASKLDLNRICKRC